MPRRARAFLPDIPLHVIQRGNNRQACLYQERDFILYLCVCKMMHDLGTYYVRYVNSCYGRAGALWEGRYRASFVESEKYLLTLCRYIELNTLRARMVNHPADYPWSSFRHNAMGIETKLIQEHPAYAALGKSKEERRTHYLDLHQHAIPDLTIQDIRDACNKSWVLGDNKFKEQIETQLGHALPPFPRGGDRKSNRGSST